MSFKVTSQSIGAFPNNPVAPFLPADRNFAWNPGLTSKGGIPFRTTIFTTLTPSGGDDTTQINTALTNCPAGQVVKLSAGTFLINTTQTPLMLSKGITLRGSGAGVTTIQKNTQQAARRTATNIQGTTLKLPPTQGTMDNCPILIIGPSRFAQVDNGSQSTSLPASSSNLTVDGLAGSSSITVANASGFVVGQCALLDELTVPSLQPTPRGFLSNNTNGTEGTVQVLGGDRVIMNRHTPTQTFQDDPPDAWGFFSRADPVNVATSAYTDGRMTNEIKEIQSIVGNVVTFTSPLTITYRVSHTAQLTKYSNGHGWGNSVHIQQGGVEDLTIAQSGGGGIFFTCAAYCWAARIEIDSCFGLGIGLSDSFRCEVRDSYVHTSAAPTPAADSYAINPHNGSSELLIENNITRDYCKVIAFRACGSGSVVAYNYFDDGWDWYNTGNTAQDGANASFQECGANASHLGGCHHVLFEGNWAFNSDSDYTHGNSIYVTHFRNWYTGFRTSISSETNQRCAGGATWSWWHSWVGNVLGKPGAMSGFHYTDSRMGCDVVGNNCAGSPSSGWTTALLWDNQAVWKLGYDPERWAQNPDAQTLALVIRDGNYDYLTNSQHWHNTPATFTIPNSMYLASKPAFFGANTWPWINPTAGTTATLPAKQRYDNGTPNSP